jgi:short chain dehydrogenase
VRRRGGSHPSGGTWPAGSLACSQRAKPRTTARRASALDALAAEHPRIRPVLLDVTDASSIETARGQAQTATAGHGLDVLVNAAGLLVLGPVEARPGRADLSPVRVNLFGPLPGTRAFLRPCVNGVRVASSTSPASWDGSPCLAAACTPRRSSLWRPTPTPCGWSWRLTEYRSCWWSQVASTPLYELAAGSLPGYDAALQPYRSEWPQGFGFPERLLGNAATVDGIAKSIARAADRIRTRIASG